jgi:hypothetical protein
VVHHKSLKKGGSHEHTEVYPKTAKNQRTNENGGEII